jgi:hypothetical protein
LATSDHAAEQAELVGLREVQTELVETRRHFAEFRIGSRSVARRRLPSSIFGAAVAIDGFTLVRNNDE